jgi:hypothetical protein
MHGEHTCLGIGRFAKLSAAIKTCYSSRAVSKEKRELVLKWRKLAGRG